MTQKNNLYSETFNEPLICVRHPTNLWRFSIMKVILIFLMLLSSINLFATDYTPCKATTNNCAEPVNCASLYVCLEQEYQLVNILILKAINAVDFDQKQVCVDQRDNLEWLIEAHATTIECVDTENGPQFGG